MVSKILTTFIIALVCAIVIALIIACKVPFSLEQICYFAAGVVAAVLAGFGWFRLNIWMGAATSPGQPQTIRLQTNDTPSQITWAAIRATIKLCLVSIALVVIFLSIMSRILGLDVLALL